MRHVGVVDIAATAPFNTCENCHILKGWRTPARDGPIKALWVAKTDLEICSLMKEDFLTAANFMDHIIRDGGGTRFIAAAFVGERGLDAAGQAIYEGETGKTFRAEPPPVLRAQFIQQAQDWATAATQGGQFVGDEDCGCVADKLDVHFRSSLTIVTPRVTSTITGEGSTVLKLVKGFSDPNWSVSTGAQAQIDTIIWSGMSVSKPAGCDGKVIIKASPATKFRFWLGMSTAPDLKFALQIIPDADLHQVAYRCLLPNGTTLDLPKNDPISLFSGAWNELHGQSAKAVAMKATAAMDISKIAALDPKKLQALTDAMKNNPDPAAAAAQLTVLLNQIVPGASALAAEARSNFTFAIPNQSGCSLGTGTGFLARCDFDRTIKVPAGAEPAHTITEKTTITIGRPSPAKP